MRVHEAVKQYPFLALTERDIERTSEKFVAIPTRPILERLESEGYTVGRVKIAGTRKGDAMKAAHMVEMRRPADERGVLTAWVMNGLNGTKSLQIGSGYLRAACFNSLFFGDLFGELRIVHAGERAGEYESLIEGFLDAQIKMQGVIERMRATSASREFESRILAAARKARPVLENVPDWALIKPMRYADCKSTEWAAFNIVQEKTLKGFRYTIDGRRGSVRPVKSPISEAAINRDLAAAALAA
jgi:hypothetical protein